MARDYYRIELLGALGTLVAQGLMDIGQAKIALSAYDERKEMQQTLDLVLEHERDENPVTIDEAYSSVMTGNPLPSKPGEQE